MNKILVAYATMSGSTAQVAEAVGEQIAGEGFEVDVLPLEKVNNPAEYQAVVLGAPMIMGWHRSAIAFLRRHRRALQHTPLAIFALALSLTANGERAVKGIPVYLDPSLPKTPRNPKHLSLREDHASLARYAASMLQAAGPNHPVSVAFFGGRLDYTRLKPLPRLFVMLVIQAQPGDRRNWQAIRTWASDLPQLFVANPIQN